MKVHGLLLLNTFNSMCSVFAARITPHWEDSFVPNVSDKVYVVTEEEECGK